jgi:hypothetical protein
MSKPNGVKRVKKEKLDMWWEPKELDDLREMKRLTGRPMAKIIRGAVKQYLAKERPRLSKLAKLHAQLLP